METITFGEIFSFAPVSRTKVSEEKSQGKYPFYAPNSHIPLKTDKSQFNGPALIISKAGSMNIHYCEGPFSATSDFIIANPNRNCFVQVNPLYVYFYLFSNLKLLENGLRGRNEISKQFIQKIEIPINSLEVQEKIAGTLLKVETVIRKRETNLLLVAELKKKAFLNFFGDPVLDKERFPFSATLRDLAVINGGGNYQTEATSRRTDGQMAQLTQTAITQQEFDPAQNKIFAFEQTVNPKHLVQKGDVLFPRKSSPKLLGSTVYVYDETNNLTIPDTIWRIFCNPKLLSGIYLTYLLNDENFSKKFRNYSGGTLQTMPGITIKDLQQVTIPYPELALQHQFENAIHSIRRMEYKMTQQLSRLYQLMASASNDLFAGKGITNIEMELDILLNKVDPESDNNDYTAFRNKPLANKLIRKISREEDIFPTIEMYNRAKRVVFHLLKKGIITQEYDPEKNKMNLHIK